MDKKSTTFRKLLAEDEVLNMIYVGTAHQALIAERAGFKAVGVSGSSYCIDTLGLPDAGLLTLTELVEGAERICRVVNLPVMVDCDTGFGNAINVRRTVDAVIRTGAAGLFIEDQVAPKRCGFVKGKEIISLEEAIGKYRAAIDVRNELDPDFVIMARTDARGAVGGSVEEVIRRGKAYLDVGVDILYVEALQSRDEIRQVRSALKDCLLKVTPWAIKPPLTQKETKELGLCSTSLMIDKIGVVAMYDFLLEYKERGVDAFNDFCVRTEGHPLGGFGRFDLVDHPKIVEWEKKYLPQEDLEKYDKSLGVYDPRISTWRGKPPTEA